MNVSMKVLAAISSVAAMAVHNASTAELRVGAAVVDVTPSRPVALDGQFKTRISEGVASPLLATAVALEGRDGDRVADQAILLSADLLFFKAPTCQALRERLKKRLPDFDAAKLVLTATHTHTAPVLAEGWYAIPEGVTRPAEYHEFLLGRLEDVAARAWESRRPGGVSWGLGQTAIGHNRRTVYADSSAKMYGSPRDPGFRGLEGGEDPGVGVLAFWSEKRELLAIAVNVACPAQVLENQKTIGADFWHDAREAVRAHLGKEVLVLGWPGACGDLSPRHPFRKAAEERMLKLRGTTAVQEIGRRLGREVAEVCALLRNDVRTEVPFAHRVERLTLPVRKVTEQEVAAAQKELEALKEKGEKSLRNGWLQTTMNRYQNQDQQPTFAVDAHVLRLGDVAIATSPFELFSDYGAQIEGRSRAEQTFVIELTDGWESYLPTSRAVAGGGYSAVVQSNRGGPEAGQILLDRTVEAINALWPEDPAKPKPAPAPIQPGHPGP
jgi:hypothetical protein